MDDARYALNFYRPEEFPQLEDNVYLDHAGSTLCSRRQVEAFAEQMKRTAFANPHSRHALSQNTSTEIAKVRNRILQFFNTDSTNYTVIFTSGATAAMKLTAECFDFGPEGVFAHLREVHTSVLGMRQVAESRGATSICFQEENVFDEKNFESIFFKSTKNENKSQKLVVFPGQCNFSGRKYPLFWVEFFQQKRWKVFLDAAAFVATSVLDLSVTQPDFVALSFYKIFGFPSGLGALLVKKSAESCLKKTYFGGGAVELAVSDSGFHVLRPDFTKRMEDGTLPYLDIIALNHGFEAIETLAGGMRSVSRRTHALARYTWLSLKELRHANGTSVVELYGGEVFSDSESQGPVVVFNLKDRLGSMIGFTSVEKVAESFKVQLRTGCFCNTGACQKYLGLTTEDLMDNFHAGHVCGDSTDMINGKPTGAVRISFGYMSTKSDADRFLHMIQSVFTDNSIPGSLKTAPPSLLDADGMKLSSCFLSHLFIYPVKSCQGMQVGFWPLGQEGFLYDRKCFIRNTAGTSITLKHNSKLHEIVPAVDLKTQEMALAAPGMPVLVISLRDSTQSSEYQEASYDPVGVRTVPDMVNSRVCGRPVQATPCGQHASQWLTEYLQDDVYSLMRYHSDHPRNGTPSRTSSAANSAPFLIICSASLDCLLATIPSPHPFSREDLIERMRPNLVVETAVPFEEDGWSRIRIGSVDFEVIEPCSRCQMVNISSRSGERTSEPLQSIIRLRGKEMHFGVLLRQVIFVEDNRCTNTTGSFTLQEGDKLEILTAEN